MSFNKAFSKFCQSHANQFGIPVEMVIELNSNYSDSSTGNILSVRRLEKRYRDGYLVSQFEHNTETGRTWFTQRWMIQSDVIARYTIDVELETDFYTQAFQTLHKLGSELQK